MNCVLRSIGAKCVNPKATGNAARLHRARHHCRAFSMLGVSVGDFRDSFTARPFLFMPLESGKYLTKATHLATFNR